MSRKNMHFGLMSALVAISLLLSACAPATATLTEAPATATLTEAPATTAPAVEVTLYTVAPSPIKEADVERVQEAVSAMLKQKGVNVDLKIVAYDWGSAGDKINATLSTGEPCDLMFTSPWFNSFTEGVSKGYYLPLDDLLASEAPELLTKYAKVWDVARVGGKIYAVPNQQIWPRAYTFYIGTDILDKYPVDWDTIGNGIQGLKDMLPYAKTVLAGEPHLLAFIPGGVSGLGGSGGPNESEVFGYSRVVGGFAPFVVKYDDPAMKVVLEPEAPYFLELAQVAREYTLNKITLSSDLTPDELMAAFKATPPKFVGEFWMFAPGMWPPIPQPYYNNRVFDGKRWLGANFLDTSGIQATLTAICSTSPHPAEALQVLNLLHTDAEIHNTVTFGVEGQDWLWVDKATKEIKYPEGTDVAQPPYLLYDWMMGDTFLNYYLNHEMAQADPNKAAAEINNTAPASVVLGFVFDPTPVSAEMAQISAVVTEEYMPIVTGRVENPEEMVAKYLRDLKAAGADTVLAEIQRQIDAWAAAK